MSSEDKALLAEVTFKCHVNGHTITVRTHLDKNASHITTTEHDIKAGDIKEGDEHTPAMEMYNHMMESMRKYQS